MKHLKILGLLAVAAAALMAFAGAGTASATELCKVENESPCTNNMYPTGTVIHAESEGHVTLKAGFANVKCNSTVEGKTTNTGGASETVKGDITSLTFTGCTENCEAKALENADHTFGQLEVHTEGATANNNGTLTGSNTRVTVKCGEVSCLFGSGTGTDLGLSTGTPTAGQTMATFDVKANVPWLAGDSSNAVCTLGTGTSKWEGAYTVTKPEPLYVE